MNKSAISKIFEILKKDRPKPTTELKYKSKFQLLISVILSAQATDKSVNSSTVKLFKIAGTPEKIFNLGEKKLKNYIRNIGLFNSKAKNVIKTSEIIFKQYNNKIPSTRDSLQKLPGVGRKTANVVLNNAFGEPTIGVDTHVYRVSNRLGIAPGKNVLEVENNLEKNIPNKYKHHAHHWLIFLGRYTCLARKPLCTKCKVIKFCRYKKKTDHD
ncbi:MAG: endonuclease III [Gammaproteobacteria bacterium]|nr:endonuclease III [Gammaproteobacteria bacterium]|tara:strand:+ start:14346 stop:14984 length:639 start_codon:yes stop_codon:yes gene_type:complete